jgi:hypothetical protein
MRHSYRAHSLSAGRMGILKAMPSVLITGSNRGLGLEWSRQYAKTGWRVLATCRHPEAADELGQLAAPYRGSAHETGRVEMWRGGVRLGLSVPAPFVWRCLISRAVAPFPHPAHRTGQAAFPHPALGQDFMPLPTEGAAEARADGPVRVDRVGTGRDSVRVSRC